MGMETLLHVGMEECCECWVIEVVLWLEEGITVWSGKG